MQSIPDVYSETVLIELDPETILEGELSIPAGATAVVLFAHGSGSSRHSPRNRYVAEVLQQAGLATLLFDLLTPSEEELDLESHEYRFDIKLLAHRLVGVSDWISRYPKTRHLEMGYFGASTGAAAALVAASERPQVKAVVSKGGRPDLANHALEQVKAATLLIVGGWDEGVMHLNQKALKHLHCTRKLASVAGATHLFEEPGKLEEVAVVAADWLAHHLKAPTPVRG